MHISRTCGIVVAFFLGSMAFHLQAGESTVQFNRDIRPILSDNCFTCHGPDAKTRKADLRLDLESGALQSESPVIIRNHSDKSELFKRITSTDPEERMPPAKFGKELTPREIQLIQQWIDTGADWEGHWAFLKPERPTPPSTQQTSWARNDIDHFVLARLEEANLTPSKEANRQTLIRRLALDLTGLPPSPAEVSEFLSDETPEAYDTLVNRLLNSPRYGEHMAKAWLDLARYADSNGYQYDTERTMWRWRDWVIEAFNQNLPYDQFTIDQLAGDLVPDATIEQKLATGFNRNHPITIEGGIIDEEYRTEYVIDRVTTTGTVWLGLTMGCARCHDHKYDPISSKDFYRFFAFFNQVPEKGNSGFSPNLKAPTQRQANRLSDLKESMATLSEQIQKEESAFGSNQEEWEKSQDFQSEWTVVQPDTVHATAGSDLKILEDASVLASGKNPPDETYQIKATVNSTGITVIRLEALTDPSLPHRGPGRYENANFVLSEFELVAQSKTNPDKSEKIKFRKAMADHSQKSYNIASAIDGNVGGNTGWAVDGPTRRENRTAVFIAEQPFGYDDGTELQFALHHKSGVKAHNVGRVRLSISTHFNDELPLGVALALSTENSKRSEAEKTLIQQHFYKSNSTPELTRLRKEFAAQQEEKNKIESSFPTTMVMKDMDKPRDTFMLERGQYDQKGEKVTPGLPEHLNTSNSSANNRLDLARWLVSPDNPLTARVAVNRLWMHHFGIGLVKTAEDFGVQGEWPSHPKLLDWLATEFIRQGWDMKAMHRLIVTSATYRQSAAIESASLAKDPANRLLSHSPRLRLDAEVIRDSALAIAGLLDSDPGGRGVFPYQPDGLWMELNNRRGYSKKYARSKGSGLYRRSIYTYWKRTVPPPTMQLFDAPGREFCVVQRSRTTTPLQALALLHDPQFVEAARHFAERIVKNGGNSDESRLKFAMNSALSRNPNASEKAVLMKILEEESGAFKSNPETATHLLAVGDSKRDESIDPVLLASWTSVARVLLNLDETVTKP